MSRVRDLLHQALDLPLKQRARIAQQLIHSLDEGPPENPDEVAKSWGDEIARRLDELRSGRTTGVPVSTVKKDLDRTLRSVRTRKRRASR